VAIRKEFKGCKSLQFKREHAKRVVENSRKRIRNKAL